MRELTTLVVVKLKLTFRNQGRWRNQNPFYDCLLFSKFLKLLNIQTVYFEGIAIDLGVINNSMKNQLKKKWKKGQRIYFIWDFKIISSINFLLN